MSSSLSWPPARTSRRLTLCALALLFTLLNCLLPLQIDDAAYYYYARQIAHDPGDPYGGPDVLWYHYPQRPNEVLAPLLLPYWWSLAIRIFGDAPFWWKFWLLPFSLLFLFALHALFRRFARGLEIPLLLLTVFSPAFLPSLNLMLDIPALALGLSGVVLFLRAVERNSLPLALLAGLSAGLAMQTKYTGFLAPATLLLYALLFGRPRLGLAAVLVAATLFIGWELRIARQYGESHFLLHYRDNEFRLEDKICLILPLLTNLGGVAPAGALLGLAALGCARRWIVAAGLFVLLGYGVLAVVPNAHATFTVYPETAQERLTLGNTIFGIFGAAECLIALAVGWRLLAAGRPIRDRERGPQEDRTLDARSPVPVWKRQSWFLVLWLGLEIAGYFALTPFPAVRRLLGVLIVAALLIGRLAARTCRTPARRAAVHDAVILSVLLGLLFFVTDWRDASSHQQAAELAADWIRQQDAPADAATWYIGHWGFQFYAERAGMQPLVPYGSWLRPGDWLVVPMGAVSQQSISLGPGMAAEVGEVAIGDGLPFRTISCFYGGRVPLEHQQGPRMWVTIYRIGRAGYVPAGS